jgi:hypothetical protein
MIWDIMGPYGRQRTRGKSRLRRPQARAKPINALEGLRNGVRRAETTKAE